MGNKKSKQVVTKEQSPATGKERGPAPNPGDKSSWKIDAALVAKHSTLADSLTHQQVPEFVDLMKTSKDENVSTELTLLYVGVVLKLFDVSLLDSFKWVVYVDNPLGDKFRKILENLVRDNVIVLSEKEDSYMLI